MDSSAKSVCIDCPGWSSGLAVCHFFDGELDTVAGDLPGPLPVGRAPECAWHPKHAARAAAFRIGGRRTGRSTAVCGHRPLGLAWKQNDAGENKSRAIATRGT
jgi:hypothetical protein